MDYLSIIKHPIEAELNDFVTLFNQSLSHEDGLLGSALEHIRKRAGKRMRPMLILLMAKNFGEVSKVTQNSAVGLELLHTASLVHDDVVDESSERRGQASVNATYDNKVLQNHKWVCLHAKRHVKTDKAVAYVLLIDLWHKG